MWEEKERQRDRLGNGGSRPHERIQIEERIFTGSLMDQG